MALWVSACMTNFFTDTGWLDFQSINLSVCAGFLHTVMWMVWLELGVQLVSKKEMLPSLSGHSILNMMWASI